MSLFPLQCILPVSFFKYIRLPTFKGAHIYPSAFFFSIFGSFMSVQKDTVFPKATRYKLAQGHECANFSLVLIIKTPQKIVSLFHSNLDAPYLNFNFNKIKEIPFFQTCLLFLFLYLSLSLSLFTFYFLLFFFLSL